MGLHGEMHMYVTTSGIEKYRVVQLREDVRIPGTNRKKAIVIKTYGKYADLLAEDPDFLRKLKERAKQMTKQRKESETPLTIEAAMTEIKTVADLVPSYRFGHAIVNRLWAILGLDEFFESNCGKRNADAVKNAIYYLVAHRCSTPDSIRGSVLEQEKFAGVTPIGLDVFYCVLDVLADSKDELVSHLCAFFKKKTKRSDSLACYDVTTYAFESTKWGELRLFGFSKDHKNNEVQVVMGLLIDNNGIPINYELFAGSTMDQNTLQESVNRLAGLYGLTDITVVADRGMNSNDNLLFLHGNGYHFVVSYTLKRSKEEFKKTVLDESIPWAIMTENSEDGTLEYASKILQSKVKARIRLTDEEIARLKEERKQQKAKGRTPIYKEVEIDANIHVTYSAKRARKDAADRQRMIDRLKDKLATPSKLKAALRRGCNQYLQMDLDEKEFSIDENKIKEAEKFDGYYAVVTDRMELTTEEAMKIYRGQWKIEESFRVLKTDLKARPVFVWSDNHIKGHFVICYLCLCIIRYLQYLISENGMENLSAEEIMNAISKPVAIVQGRAPKLVVTPAEVPQSYIDITKMLGFPPLMTNMTLTRFRATTKLNLMNNIK
jgi:Transposase